MQHAHSEKQRDFWESKRKRRSPDNPVILAFAGPKIQCIQDCIPLAEHTRLLDIGCGNGFFTYHFAKKTDTVGLDFSRQMLQLNPCSNLVQGSALCLPFPDESFDVVFCSNLLHHIEEPARVIAEMKRVSRNYVVVTEPNRNNPLMALFHAAVPQERGALRFSLRYLNRVLEECDLHIIRSFSLGSIVPNKTPKSLLGFFKVFDVQWPLGFYLLAISSKKQ